MNMGGLVINAWQARRLLTRAREDARREALEEAAHAVMATGRLATDGLVRLGRMEQGYAQARGDCYEAIRALLAPTPQRESRVDQKRPPHPEELVNALQDRVHPASGPLIQSKPVTPQGETKEPRGFAGIPFIVDPAVPPGEAQFVDPVDGRVIGRITGAAGGMEQP